MNVETTREAATTQHHKSSTHNGPAADYGLNVDLLLRLLHDVKKDILYMLI